MAFKEKNQKVEFCFLTQLREALSNPSLCTKHKVRPKKLKHQSEAEKGLLQGQARRKGGSCSKDPNLNSGGFQGRALKATLGVWVAGGMTFF